ncbi:prepilin peptidase [Halalkalibacillus sediminis]|uniref:Prepilin peptidase n=1 Tax=Halalkalibacillus sediminis TaxID=2018042 RepID=A0A2I0QRJ1_9BACI|nr:A24 family peptidase [Halalkalibacillus sediminis]PKR76943.1 prepilin peptidase [Halalkalibacillus sediminis]
MMVLVFIYAYIAVLGLIMGSFYNVVGLRVPNGESIVRPPSHCPNCNRRLGIRELIPVLSYIFQRGKCRSCYTKISPIYPFFEALTAALFVFTFHYIGFDFEVLVAWALCSLLVIITISDLHYQIIPDKVLLFFGGLMIALRFWLPTEPWYDAFFGAAMGFGLLLLIAVVSRGGMGGGDIKLFAVLGLALGISNTLLTLFLAAVLGTIVGLMLVPFHKVKRGVPFAFGPFIAVGALISYFYGETILDWYVTTFF